MVEATEMGPVAPAEAFIRTAAAAAEVVEFSDYTEDSGGSVIERCSIYPQNDIGNAKRLREHYGTRLMWVPGRGWYAWIGSHWSRADGPRLAQIWAQRVAGLIRKETKVLAERGPLADELPADFEKRLQARTKWAVTSGMAPRLKAMLEVLAPMVSVEVDELDQLRYALNVENGTLDLIIDDDGADKVGRWALRPHDPEDRITNLAAVSYVDGAEAPRWRQFVSEVQPVYEDALYLQRMAGYGLTGDTREEKVFLSYGEGSNGKSTYWEVVADLMGTYAVTLPFETFLDDPYRSGGQATPDLARLPGKRLVLVGEPDVTATFSEGMIKRVTGTDKLNARDLYQEQISFRPQFKLYPVFNQKPKVRGQDHGIWRRFNMLGWRQTFIDPAEAQSFPGRPLKDKGLMAELRTEASGILNWMLSGFAEWAKSGLAEPEGVRIATDEYRRESDALGDFLRTCTGEGGHTQAALLYDAYQRWCKANAIDPLSNTAFGRRLANKEIARQEIGGKRYWALTVTAEDFLPSPPSNRDDAD